ncbi:uncharacterized protein LOC118740176 [Rhagoletis pomonella]|uniref:uncharacterized protein LOC118740176 n=1 Tax=Rhagoletis pomonella TaxID=28610 RepID=UPI0017835678|nr:uncharacterized protein LOC118740176 [Rhagoletis pomonella]
MFRYYFILALYVCKLPFSLQDLCTFCKCVHGQYADAPIWIDVGKRNEIAVQGHSCARPVTYTWKVVSGSGEIITDLGTTKVPRVVWLPFTVSVKPSEKGENNRIVVTKSDGRTKGRCECHIDFINLEMYSHIDGSELISIGSEQIIELDGSKSFDYSQPKGNQHYIFEWTCRPIEIDMDNQYCKEGKVMSTGSKLKIDGHYLSVRGLYQITLHTKSPVTGLVAGDQIYIRVEYGTQIPLIILCERNCLNYRYNEGVSIFLHVDCIGYCGISLKFYFWVDDVFITSNHNGKVRFMPPNAPTFKFNVTLVADGVVSKAKAHFMRNDPPTGGICTVAPKSGIPGDTLFRVACKNWTDPDLPLYYTLKAGNLLYDRTTDPNWEVYVPQVPALTVRICDHFDACTKHEVPLELTPAVIPRGLQNIMKYMQWDANNIEKLLNGGHFARAVVKATLMMKDQPLEVLKHILSAFGNFDADSLADVRQLGTMTSQLVEPMGNLTSEKVEVFRALLDKISDGFAKTIENGEIKDLDKEDLVDMSDEIVGMVSKFATKSEQFVDVQSLLWEFEGGMAQVAKERAMMPPRVAHLIEHYGAHNWLNDTVLTPINRWMHVVCKTFVLLHDIGVASSLNVHKGDKEFIVNKLTVQMSTFGIDDGEPLLIVSLDYLTTAVLTLPMLQDMQSKLGGKEMTAQVVSFRENPFWWYPNEHPITTSVFYFSSFNEEDLSLAITELDVPLRFEMLQQRLPTEPPMIRHSIRETNEMPIYRVRAPEGAAIIINFKAVDVDMDALVKCNYMPNEQEVRAGIRIKADAIGNGTKCSASNDAGEPGWCYVALIAAKGVNMRGKAANYAFNVELYECLTWNVNLDNPVWRTDGCSAALDSEGSDNITCFCYHMSIFAGRSYYSTAEEVVRERLLKESLDVNWYLVSFYILLILVFIWLLLRTCDDLATSQAQQQLVPALAENERKKSRNIALHITTGGQWTAASSANVVVALPGGRSYTITQNPEQPHLKPYATGVLELPVKASELQGPLQITISQDKSGRYPSWYCESITIVNLENGEKQHCTVRKWIGAEPVVVQPDEESQNDSAVEGAAGNEQISKAQKWKKVKAAYHDVFTTWFLFQPLFGPWQYGVVKVDRFVRSCIWIAKFAVILLLVFLYFGDTNLNNYEAERSDYEFLIRVMDGWFLLFLLCCYVLTFLVELLLLLVVYPEVLTKSRCKGPKENGGVQQTAEKKPAMGLSVKEQEEDVIANPNSQDDEETPRSIDEAQRKSSRPDVDKGYMM